MDLWLFGVAPTVVVLLILLVLLPRCRCPKCRERLPRLRVPTSGRQFLQGGWTCPGCGSELDRQGRVIGS